MPEYKYLEDGTPVTAEELNTRFDTLMGEDKGVNAVTPDMLALGALRHNQIPGLIGKKEQTKEELESGFTYETTTQFIRDTSDLGRGYAVTSRTIRSSDEPFWAPLERHTFNQPIIRPETGLPDAHAIIVLANIHVNRFAKFDSQVTDGLFKVSMRERKLGIAFRLVAEVTWGDGRIEDLPLSSSARGVSPGFTIDYNSATEGESGYPMVNSIGQYDYRTFKDVALRSVFVVPEVEAGAIYPLSINAIRIDASQYGAGCEQLKARIDKLNLTAIPMHTKVYKHGGS